MVHPLRNILNRLRWDKNENPDNYLITYRHRGAPADIKQIKASKIQVLGKSYFTIRETTDGDETVIPLHRILEVRRTEDGAVFWVKRKPA